MHQRRSTRAGMKRTWRGAVLAVATTGFVTVGLGTATAFAATGVTASVVNGHLVVTGTSGDDQVAIRLQDPSTLAVDSNNDGTAEFLFPRSQVGAIDVNLGAGNDLGRIDQVNGLFTDTIPTTLAGNAGNDTLIGGDGSETLRGGAGNDFVDGNRGNDIVSMGDGDDTFNWDPGDGSDVVDGGAGNDRVVFNGSNAAETYDFSANGNRLALHRDVAGVTTDASGIDQVDLTTRGSADVVNVHGLTGTDVKRINVDLSGSDGQGDQAADQVNVEGTAGPDNVQVTTDGTTAHVAGLAAAVTVSHGEPSLDTLNVNTLGGDDNVTSDPAVGAAIHTVIDGGEGNDTVTTTGTDGPDTFSAVPSAGSLVAVANGANQFYEMTAESLVLKGLGGDDTLRGSNGLDGRTTLTLAGGAGSDTLVGGDGADVLRGGPGNDFVDGGRGSDVVSMGDGNDTFNWDPGDGSDVIDGDAGSDHIVFNGSNASEHIDLSANGNRLRLVRDVAGVTMDAGSVENVDVDAKGSPDNIAVHDLTGSSTTAVNVDLAGIDPTQGDAAADTVTVDGTNGVDAIEVSATNGVVKVGGVAAVVKIAHAEAALDLLDINTLDGNDAVNSTLPPGIIQLLIG